MNADRKCLPNLTPLIKGGSRGDPTLIKEEIYQFKFDGYQLPFRQPLITSHGCWKIREGIIVSLQHNDGRIGWGEISPLPWFGSETLAAATYFCQQLGDSISDRIIQSIPDELPATQFGIISALEDLTNKTAPLIKGGSRGDPTLIKGGSPPAPLQKGGVEEKGVEEGGVEEKGVEKGGIEAARTTCLLPAGEKALTAWESGFQQGQRTFKWKIAVGGAREEREIFSQLVTLLPAGSKLRLDANGGLTLTEARNWLELTDKYQLVEFMEQPLPPSQLEEMLQLHREYHTALALDESVATVKQLEQCYEKGWRGIFVIKGAIAGSPQRLRQFCQEHSIDAVFSSVFETNIGRKAVLRLAAELSSPHRAVGFGLSWPFE